MNNTNFSDDWLIYIPTIVYSVSRLVGFYRKSFHQNTTNHFTELVKSSPSKCSKCLHHHILPTVFRDFHHILMCHHSDSLQLFNGFHCPKTQLFKFREVGLALFHYLKGVKLALFQKCLVSKPHHIKMRLFSVAFGKCNCFPLLFQNTERFCINIQYRDFIHFLYSQSLGKLKCDCVFLFKTEVT